MSNHADDERGRTLAMVIPAVCVGIVFLGIGVVSAMNLSSPRGDVGPGPPRASGIGPGTCLADVPDDADMTVSLDDDGLRSVPCSDPLAELWIGSVGGPCHEWTVVAGGEEYCARAVLT